MRRIFKYIPILIVVELLICLIGAIPVQAAASIALSTTAGVYGTSVTVNGSGYVATENVYITFATSSGPTTVVPSFAAGATSWSKTFTVPSAIYGGHAINAVSDGVSAIVSGPTFTVTPTIISSAASGNMGTPLTVSGYGFRANEAGVMVTFAGSVVTTTSPSVDAEGFWSTTFNIPSTTVGTVVIDAYGNGGTGVGNVPDLSFTVISVSNIAIGVSSGKVGTSITVNGNGFAANETGITVTFRGNAVGATTTASASGSWSIAFAIPAAPSGSHPIDAYGVTTTAATVPDLSFTVIPSFSLNKNTGASGAPVTATGSGFAASETGITITYDSTPVGSTTANSSGGWSINFNVPSLPSGNHTVSAYGSTTAANTSTDITFTTSSGISINKTSGAAGTQVTVTGSGFAANETGITVTYDGNAVGNPVTANPSGSWTLNFTIPPSSGGSHAIDASGAVTSATTITDLSFSIATSLSVSSTGGRVGDAVTVRGTGFSANETSVVVTYDGNPVSQSTSANASGDWSTTFTVPPSPSGSHAIAAKGSATTAGVSGGSFNVDPFASISPASGNIGSSATLSGSGFTANSDLQLTFDGNLLTTDKVTSDVTGSFSKSIIIPKSTSGSHAIKVKYGNKEYSLTFSIGSIDLTLPRIISPADGESVSIIGDATPNFKWSPISSPNGGITYILQIDTDPEFPAPILQKTNIPSAQYTLTKSEALPNGQYYWRVRAVDAASNQSDWTHPAILQSGVMSPTLFIIVIVVAVIIIVLLLIFFLFRPMQKKKRALEAAARQPAPSISPEIVIPEVINAEYRTVDSEEPGKRKALPWRLALPQAPQAPKGSKTLSSEDQARLKCIIDFAKSLPLLEPGNNTNWLVDIAENTTGSNASPALYEQVLKGEIQLRYEPAWTRHPTFMDLQVLLEGQVLLQDLNSYIDAVNHTATEALRMLQDIYRDIAGAVTWDILEKGGWDFVSAVYTDALSWFMGKHLREPSERDYSIKSDKQAGVDTNTFGLYGEPNTPFARLLVWHTDDKEVMQLRTLHLKLRRNYRNNDKARDVVSIITQLDVQRGRLLSAFSQFNRLNP